MEEKRYMISDASRMLNVESHVLRYWEEELDINIPRTEMGHRYYTEEHINLLKYIRDLKRQGYGLRAIKSLIKDNKKRVGCNKEFRNVKNMKIEDSLHFSDSIEDGFFNAPAHKEMQPTLTNRKMEQFQEIMDNIVSKALKASTQNLSKELSDNVSENVLKGINYMMRVQDEKEEERYKKLDELMRSRQRMSRKDRKKRAKAEKNLSKNAEKKKVNWRLKKKPQTT